MSTPIRDPLTGTGTGARKIVALLGAVLAIGAALYLSRSPLPPAPAADDPTGKTAPTPRAVEAANAFLGALDAKQREKAIFEFGSPKKSGWSNLPVTFVPRNGVRLGDLTKEQRTKAMDVVAAVLSKGGYQKVVDIMDGDQLLAEGKGGKGGKDKGKGKGGKGMFGVDQYYLAIFGKPSATEPWMVQFGGHHLGVNVTVIGKHFVLTPTHTGAQPTLFKRDGKDVRPLGLENDTAFKLIAALDDKQRAQAIIGDRPQGELLLGPGRDGRKIEPKGIKGSALKADQQALLLDLIGAWINIVEPDEARARMASIKGKIGETYFAWSGPTEKGSAVYFRIQGPTVVIEYAPQGGTDHIHTVIRNPEDDYGAGLLKR
ncbi:MAG: DUF3500 domain-containing protein [Gemmataceae bacterium]